MGTQGEIGRTESEIGLNPRTLEKKLMDTQERIELVKGKIHTLESRLLSVSTPQHTKEYCDHLRRQAIALIERAERIEAQLAEDIVEREKIRAELKMARVELRFFETCRRLRVRPNRNEMLAMFRQLLDELGD